MTHLTKDELINIARICHEASRAYYRSIGDDSQLPWSNAPAWQRGSAIDCVQFYLAGEITSEQCHEEWLRLKEQDGWMLGSTVDFKRKTHPCLVPYSQLTEEQKMKDKLFTAIVGVFKK